MVKPLRTALIVGAGALAYKLLTKEPLATDENVKNGTVGAVAGMVGVPQLERLVKGELGDGENKTLKSVLLYSAAGAGIGYLLDRGAHRKVAGYAQGLYDKHLKSDE